MQRAMQLRGRWFDWFLSSPHHYYNSVPQSFSTSQASSRYFLDLFHRSCKWSSLVCITVGFIILLITTTKSVASNNATTPPLWESPHAFQQQTSFLRHRSEVCTSKDPCLFAMVADLDHKSKVIGEKEDLFRSYILGGRLISDSLKYQIDFFKPKELFTKLNEGGRGLELSELNFFKGRLLTFDDRSGIVFEYTANGTLIPRHIIAAGDGSFAKGMKIEWATEKDNKLWIGSFGKEYTDTTGARIISETNFWITVLDEFGNLERKNWKQLYNLIRDKVGVPYPGYILHEAVNWSPYLKKWVFLPRRVSQDPYNESNDETKGSNLMILASKDFSTFQIKTIGEVIPERGYSSFKFIPGTRDQIILAIKSVENSKNDLQKSYLSVFSTMTGEIYLSDLEIPHDVKYEGIEFIHDETQFPLLFS